MLIPVMGVVILSVPPVFAPIQILCPSSDLESKKVASPKGGQTIGKRLGDESAVDNPLAILCPVCGTV